LSPPDPSPNYEKAVKQRQANTGLWFLEGEDYAAWKTNPASFIWLYGIPGCGKTILSSTILQNILEYCANDTGKVVAYFYFDFNDTQKQSPELMIRSLVSQLSQQCVKIPATLEALFSSCENGQRQPSLDSLLEVMRSIIHEFPESYIVLDALDECTDRTELIAILERTIGLKLEGSHLLVTSRKERDIEISLETIVDTQNIICLQSKRVDKDIRTYVRQSLSDNKDLSKWRKDPEIKHEIEMALVKGAQGMCVYPLVCL
jgi:Cdc6-like AAA superfamily ATPase